jgi:hypothetical protein
MLEADYREPELMDVYFRTGRLTSAVGYSLVRLALHRQADLG